MSKTFADLKDNVLANKVLQEMIKSNFRTIKNEVADGDNNTLQSRMSDYIQNTFGIKIDITSDIKISSREYQELFRHVIRNSVELPEGELVSKIKKDIRPELDFSQVSSADGYKILSQHLKDKFEYFSNPIIAKADRQNNDRPAAKLQNYIKDTFGLEVHVNSKGEIPMESKEMLLDIARGDKSSKEIINRIGIKTPIKIPNAETAQYLKAQAVERF